MNAKEFAHELEKAASFIRQQQAEIEELEKENNDLRYLIATKLEQQDGISLNSMAHPITNTPEPSYEIDPDKLETIEIDLQSPEPVAWTDGQGNYFDKNSFFPVDDLIPLYTHPVKELTDEDRSMLIRTLKWSEDLLREAGHDEAVSDAQDCLMILRKAREK